MGPLMGRRLGPRTKRVRAVLACFGAGSGACFGARFCGLFGPFSGAFVVAFLVAFLGATFGPTFGGISSAHAETDVDGTWKQGPLVEDFTVQQWLAGCGPEPSTTRTGGGETATVRSEGDELVIAAGGRVFRTNECYDPMPNLRREAHSRDASGKSWRTRCTTPPNDPRKATLNTLVVLTNDKRIDVVETGRYEVTLETGRCMADVKRTRSYDLVVTAPATPAASAAAEPSPATKPNACEAPGPPASLEVRPSRKLLRTGESFVFQARVVDAKGCATHTPTTWRLDDGSQNRGVVVDRDGKVTISEQASEGAVELVASAAGKSTRVVVEVSEPAHYEALLARSGLNAAGENEAASVVAIDSQSIGAGETSVEDRAKGRRLVFVAIVAGALVLLGILALVFLRRSRRAAALEREALDRHEARVREALETRKRREDEHAEQVRAHERSIVESAARKARKAQAAEATAPLACPVCGRTWTDGTTFCPHDGVRLVEAKGGVPPGTAAASPTAPKRGKICPTCGDRFDGAAEYCGKDGTQLVLLN